MASFAESYDDKVSPWMEKIDQVRTLLQSNEDEIEFPNVVVVGDQSSGKSTLLEALSMVELPKGTGIVTRCPLVLRLRHAQERKVYRVLNPNEKEELDETTMNIMEYIIEETKKIAGDKKKIVHDMMEILVEDPCLRNLTVVDLPGIVRNPIGDQPKDIHKQTTDLIRHYISKPGSIILAVFPANVDVATVESFSMAKEVDPDGKRTIGVITKSDLATNEQMLIDQLTMERDDVLKLRLGFIAVRNRSTDETLTILEAREREKEYFRAHRASEIFGMDCLGVDALVNCLASLYQDRILETFPKLKEQVREKLKKVRDELEKFPPLLETVQSRLAKFHELAQHYAENILRPNLNGSLETGTAPPINLLHGKFTKSENIIRHIKSKMTKESFYEKVKTAMDNCHGQHLPNFLPPEVLKQMLQEYFDKLWRVISSLVCECFNYIMSIIDIDIAVTPDDEILLKKLWPVFNQVSKEVLKEKQTSIVKLLEEMLRLEKNDTYTMNNEYITRITNWKIRQQQIKNKTELLYICSPEDEDLYSIPNEDQAVNEMIVSIICYWDVIIRRYLDYATLSIRTGFVFDLVSSISERIRSIPSHQPNLVDNYLTEDNLMKNKRKKLEQCRNRLEKIQQILGNDVMFATDQDDGVLLSNGRACQTLDQLEEEIESEVTDFEQ